jgi:hypothetical protein
MPRRAMFRLSRQYEMTATRPLAGTVIRDIRDYKIHCTAKPATLSSMAPQPYHLTGVQCNAFAP